MSATDDAFARFLEVLAASLDDHQASGDALASRVHLSRFHFDRLVSAAAGEPPATLRRRVLLERAAYRLVTTTDEVLPVAVDAGSECFARCLVIVEGVREDVEEPGEGVIRSAHARDRTSGLSATLDRPCAPSSWRASAYEYWTSGLISTAPPKRVAGTVAATAMAASRSSPSNRK